MAYSRKTARDNQWSLGSPLLPRALPLLYFVVFFFRIATEHSVVLRALNTRFPGSRGDGRGLGRSRGAAEAALRSRTRATAGRGRVLWAGSRRGRGGGRGYCVAASSCRTTAVVRSWPGRRRRRPAAARGWAVPAEATLLLELRG